VTHLTSQDLDDLAQGACLLGSGGGGPITMKNPLLELLAKEKPPRVAALDDVGDDDLVLVIAGAGAPSNVTAATIAPLADAVTGALEEAGKRLGRKIDYVAAGETGVANTLLPLVAGARMGVPIVDAAGARRSLPSLTMCVFAELPISPLILKSVNHSVLTLDVKDTASAELVLMTLIGSGSFGMVGMGLWHMQGRVARKHASQGSLTFARQLGGVIRKARGGSPVEAARQYLGGRVLFQGTIAGFEAQTAGGFDVDIANLQNQSGEDFSVYSQNENLIAWSNRRAAPAAMCPDLICYLTLDGEVFTNADAAGIWQKRKEVAVIGAPAPKDLTTPPIQRAFLKTLHSLGYGGPYVPLDILERIETPNPERLVSALPHEGRRPAPTRWQ
jgi:DUF917 family protein